MTDSTCFFTVSMKSLWNRTQFQKAPQDILRKLPEWCFISCRKMMKRRRRDCWPWEDRERERWIIRLVQNLLESSCGNTEATDCLWQVRKKHFTFFICAFEFIHAALLSKSTSSQNHGLLDFQTRWRRPRLKVWDFWWCWFSHLI